MTSLNTHPVFMHPIYKQIAKQKLDQESMKSFWKHMGTYCALTRPGHNLRNSLNNAGLVQAASNFDTIIASESGHGEELEIMARYLTSRAKVRSGVQNILPSRTPPSLQEMEKIFAVRKSLDPKNIPYNLGVTWALEVIANQNIIPGEVAAFVDSKHYQVSLTDPEMHYLAEHAGEAGAEATHEKLITEAITQLKDAKHIVQDQLTIGINDMCNITHRFYEELSNQTIP